MTNAVTHVLISLFGGLSVFAQGTFQNLDFESATPLPFGGGSHAVPLEAAFPGWVGYAGTQQVTTAFYPDVGIGSALIVLKATNTALAGARIAGNCTAVLQSGSFGLGTADVSLAQTGTISAAAMSLRFLARGNVESLTVLMNGQPLSFMPLQTFNGYSEFGADITAYANQNAELRFVESYVGPRSVFLDNISFSSVAVPEPRTWVLLVLGSAVFWCATRLRRK
jgi:hypothetical protein